MPNKLKAIDVIELDNDFLEAIAIKLQERKKEADKTSLVKDFYTTKEVAEKTGKQEATIRIHINNWINDELEKVYLKAKKVGKSWVINRTDLNQYLKQKNND